MSELQTENFNVTLTEGGIHCYEKADGKEYGWMVGGAGELLIFLVEKHATFGAVLRDERFRAYAPGTWQMVQVNPETAVRAVKEGKKDPKIAIEGVK